MRKIHVLLLISLVCFFGHTYSQAPNWIWAKSVGGIQEELVQDVSVDGAGNIYITGYFTSNLIVFGSTTLFNSGLSGSSDMYIVKYDALGNVIWANSVIGANSEGGVDITTDALGNVIVSGSYNSPLIIFGTINLLNAGGQDIFIAKYDTWGNVLWAKSVGGINDDNVNDISFDDLGNVYVTGCFFSSTITFGITTLINGGHNDIFVVKYDASGNVLWANSAGSLGSEYGIGISSDPQGNAYVTGGFSSNLITFGTTFLFNSGLNDVFVAKYDGSGNVLWAKSAGTISNEVASGIAVDAGGSLFVTGFFEGTTLSFGSNVLTSSGNFDIYIVKYDSFGNVLWANSAGGTADEIGEGITLDASGELYLVGYFHSPSIVFGSTTLSNSGVYDVFIAKYNAVGNVVWAKSSGGLNFDIGFGISADVLGNLYVVGTFDSPAISFGSTTLTNSGMNDIFIAKLSSTLNSMYENTSQSTIQIFPNPAGDNFCILLNNINSKVGVVISDITGKIVYSVNESISQKIEVNTKDFAEGLYVVSIQSDKAVETKKVMVVR